MGKSRVPAFAGTGIRGHQLKTCGGREGGGGLGQNKKMEENIKHNKDIQDCSVRYRRKKGDTMATIKGFWEDISTGKIYAIESNTFGKIVGGVGPLKPDELRDLEDYDYTQAIVDWLERAVAEHKLRRIKFPNK